MEFLSVFRGERGHFVAHCFQLALRRHASAGFSRGIQSPNRMSFQIAKVDNYLEHILRTRQPRAVPQYLVSSLLDGLPRLLTKPKPVIASLALDPLSAMPSNCGSAPAEATRIRHYPLLTARTAFNVLLGRLSLQRSAISSTIIPAQQSRTLPCLRRWRIWTTNTQLDIHEEDERFSAVAQIRIIPTHIAC